MQVIKSMLFGATSHADILLGLHVLQSYWYGLTSCHLLAGGGYT